jgi:hypothetical protein
MSEIPQDIRDTAKKVRDQLCIDCECTFDNGCGCLDALTAALAAERERCAKIADEMYGGHKVASAIRQDRRGE